MINRADVRTELVNPVTGGTQKHPLRHVCPPELHRLPHDHMIDLLVLRLRCDCQTERSGPNDQ